MLNDPFLLLIFKFLAKMFNSSSFSKDTSHIFFPCINSVKKMEPSLDFEQLILSLHDVKNKEILR